MNLDLIEAASWRTAGDPAPSTVARAVGALREWYVSRDRVAEPGGSQPRARQDRVDRGAEAMAKLAFYGVVDAPKLTFVLNELAAALALPQGARRPQTQYPDSLDPRLLDSNVEDPHALRRSSEVVEEPARWRVLDVGAGAGSTTLALAEWARANGRDVRLDAVGIDVDAEALRAAPRLLTTWQSMADAPPHRVGAPSGPRSATPRVTWQGIVGDVTRAPLPAGLFDIILCSNVLNEVARTASDPALTVLELTRRLGSALSPRGALLILEPALREPSRALHHLRDALLEGAALTVFAPCTRALAPCPMLASPRDWCHEERIVPLPERVRLVARLAGINRHTLKYAYLVLRQGGPRLADVRLALDHRVVSGKLVSKGRDEVFLCGPAGRLRVLRNRRDAAPLNAAFDELDRGQLVQVDPLDTERPRVGRETQVKAWDPGRAPQEQE